jgi:hypothetical protein
MHCAALGKKGPRKLALFAQPDDEAGLAELGEDRIGNEGLQVRFGSGMSCGSYG